MQTVARTSFTTIKTGYLQTNVGAALTLQSVPETLCERILSEAEVEALFESAPNNRERLILCTLYYSACRVSELCALQWRHLNGTVLAIHGKGGKTRHITLPAWLANELAGTRRRDAATDAPLFPRPRSGKAMTQVDVHRIVKRAANASGLGQVSPHWLRHAHASHSLSRGASIAMVQKTLGHSNLATTGRYLHVNPGESSAAFLQKT